MIIGGGVEGRVGVGVVVEGVGRVGVFMGDVVG